MTTYLSRRAAVALLGASALPLASFVDGNGSAFGADAAVSRLSARWLDAHLRLQPVLATEIGDHRFDGDVDDMSAAGRATRLHAWKGFLAELTALDRKALSRDAQVDAAILENELRYEIWDEEVFQSWVWDTQLYSDLAGKALFTLMAREYAPLPARLHFATARMEKMPRLLAQTRANLAPARVPPIFAETLAKQNPGISEVIDDMILAHADELPNAEKTRLMSAAVRLKAAVEEHQTWLNKTLVPTAKGDFRLGAKLFDEKLAFTLNSPMSRAEIRSKAEAAARETREEMYAVSVKALAQHGQTVATPDVVTPQRQQEVIEAALALAYARRPPRDKVVEASKAALARATEFVRDKDLVTLPSAPVEVVLMPEFARGVAVAYCDPPGPLDKGLKTFYTVSPIPDDWPATRVDSFLREYNSYGIQDIAVHEAMPGHYVQLWHANQCPSVLRAVLLSGSFVEGWAVYAERMVVEEGFIADDPLYRLAQLKVYLRTVTNAILDQALHVDGISKEDAIQMMTKTAFQQQSEAEGKWTRASLSSTQLSTYFVGYEEHKAIRAEAERRAGPTFALKAYHDKVLSYGSAPARYARALMFDEEIG